MKESESTPPREPCYAHTHPEFLKLEEAAEHWEELFTDCQNRDCSGLDACCSECGHLDKVARLTAKFAEEMFVEGSVEAKTAREWGWLAGLWHDLGKFAPEFQRRLKGDPASADHSTAGALWSKGVFEPAVSRLLSYVIAGHHSGLANMRLSGLASGNRSLADRLEKPPPEALRSMEIADEKFDSKREFLGLPIRVLPQDRERFSFDLSLYTRMLFSCLVDADRLCTEAFCDPDQAARRNVEQPTLAEMWAALQAFLGDLRSKARPSRVNEIRTRVLEDCIEKAESSPGLFTLTVPTGGGKTYSSLAFALKHALANPDRELRRIIYVIPFTSIIEQNANEFRKVFRTLGSDVVLEHHCNLDTDEWDRNPVARFRTENWDAPLIVTTAVQFYESLFSSKTRRTRKLHNLAQSIIILDEAQSIPVHFLQPCLWALDSLAKNYGSSVVFCTATQPSLNRSVDFPIGFPKEEVIEIVRDSKGLYEDLKRVETRLLGILSDDDLTKRLRDETQVLCIVNTRRHATAIFGGLDTDSSSDFHLSTRMCSAHRRVALDEIRKRLKEGLPCRVVSTSLIEAGVDVDFPSVYRCVAGLDSIAQAAGRCNREGKAKRGAVYIFETESEHAKIHPELAKPIDSTRLTLPHFADPLSLEAIASYFTQHYSKYQSEEGRWDAKAILDERHQSYGRSGLETQFRDIEALFKLIPEEQIPIFVPFGQEGKRLCEHWMESRTFPSARESRELQQFAVQLREGEVRALVGDLYEHTVIDGFRFLVNPDLYSAKCGLVLESAGQWSAETLTV